MENIKEIVQYCAANIEDWDIKCGMALSYIGKRRPIPYWFRSEIGVCAEEWAEDNDVELAEDFDAEDIVLYEE